MQQMFSPGRVLFGVSLAMGMIPAAMASPPPPKTPEPVIDQRPSIRVALQQQQQIDWRLDKNFVTGSKTASGAGQETFHAVRALDAGQLDQTTRRGISYTLTGEEKPRQSRFAVWAKKFDDPDLSFTNGYASVVDETIFTDLRMVRARDADKLNLDGVIIGRLKSAEFDPVELAQFLVESGIVDANIHIMARVTGSHYTSAEGHWFSLHSEDDFWTNRHNHVDYDFGIHIANDGTIQLINNQYVGLLLVKPDTNH